LHIFSRISGLIAVRQLWAAGAVSLGFSAVARWLRGVSLSGTVAGAGVCFVIYATAGLGAVGALVIVFALTWASTRFGYSRKKRLGTAEKPQGRSAAQVLANLGVAGGCCILSALNGRSVFLLGAVAALSEAAADTVSSEIGQAHGEVALMITTWQAVPAGTSGGVTGIGTTAGIAAAVAVTLFSGWVGFLPRKWLATSILAAALGMISDSLLGATFEKNAMLNNNWVNFLSTVLAAVVAMAMA
jgi:uncharacterized protein (TIGR00297 family)